MHPVIALIQDRLSAGSSPGSRNDGHRLAVVLEGGSSRAAFAGGMVAELEDHGVLPAVDAVYGSSAGALNGAWLICQRARANLHGWWVPESMRAIIRPMEALRGGPVVGGDRLIDEIYRDITPMGFEEIVASPVEYHPMATAVSDGACVDLADRIHDLTSLKAAMKATTRMPLLSGPPVDVGGDLFLDGGVSDNLPFRAAIADGATHVLVLRTRVPSLQIRPHSAVRRAPVHRWLKRNAPAAQQAWRNRPTVQFATERMIAEHPRTLLVHPPEGAPRVSVVGRQAELLEKAVRVGQHQMREALAPLR